MRDLDFFASLPRASEFASSMDDRTDSWKLFPKSQWQALCFARLSRWGLSGRRAVRLTWLLPAENRA